MLDGIQRFGRTTPTYLLAKVTTGKLAGINRTPDGEVVPQTLAPRLNITVNDRFSHPVQPEEWSLVALFVIDEIALFGS